MSARIRRWPIVTSAKIPSATADPIDATADRSNSTTSRMIPAAAISRPAGATPPIRRAMRSGNWPVEARWSERPVAGYSPALVAPAVANSAVTVISQ